VTIRAFRLYLQYEDKAIGRAMNLTHFGMTDWVSLRLNDIRRLLSGEEAKRVNIVNVYFYENECHCEPCGSWYRLIIPAAVLAVLTARRFRRASISSKLSMAGWAAALHRGHSSRSCRKRNRRLRSPPRAPCAAIRNGRAIWAARPRTRRVFRALPAVRLIGTHHEGQDPCICRHQVRVAQALHFFNDSRIWCDGIIQAGLMQQPDSLVVLLHRNIIERAQVFSRENGSD
jgi:hypothetical protein